MDALIGQIELFPYDFVPMGWAACQGQTMQINQNQALFVLIQTKFGGDGKTTFQLPDLRGAEPIPGMGYFICLTGLFPERA